MEQGWNNNWQRKAKVIGDERGLLPLFLPQILTFTDLKSNVVFRDERPFTTLDYNSQSHSQVIGPVCNINFVFKLTWLVFVEGLL
jgi:hypothetical protein